MSIATHIVFKITYLTLNSMHKQRVAYAHSFLVDIEVNLIFNFTGILLIRREINCILNCTIDVTVFVLILGKC